MYDIYMTFVNTTDSYSPYLGSSRHLIAQ